LKTFIYVLAALFAMRAKAKLREDVCLKRMSRNCLPGEKHKDIGLSLEERRRNGALQPWRDKTGMPGDFERMD
jgi:hypothetical protein